MIRNAVLAAALVAGFTAVVGAVWQIACPEEQRTDATQDTGKTERADREPEGNRAIHKQPCCLSAAADWNLLVFGPPREGDAGYRVIENATLSFSHVVTTEPIEIPVNDKRVLSRLEDAMFMPLRYAVSDDGSSYGGSGSAFPIGLLKIRATNGDFVIGISPVGFMMNETGVNSHNNGFFSWRLAKELDDLFFQKTGRRFPKKLFKSLSGIAALEDEGCTLQAYTALADRAEWMADRPDDAATREAVELGRGVRPVGQFQTDTSEYPTEMSSRVKAVAFLPSQKDIVAVTHTGSVFVSDLGGLQPVQRFPPPVEQRTGTYIEGGPSVCLSRDAKYLCMLDCRYDRTVKLWNVDSGTLVAKHECEGFGITAIAISLDGKQVALAGVKYTEEQGFRGKGGITIWFPHEKTTKTMWVDTPRITAVAFHPSEPLLTVCENTLVEDAARLPGSRRSYRWRHSLWNTKTGLLESHLPYDAWAGDPLEFDPEGRYLASRYDKEFQDKEMRITMQMWDVHNKKRFCDLPQGELLAFSPKAAGVVIRGVSKELLFVNYRDNSVLSLAKFHSADSPVAASFSPDGRMLVVGTALGQVHLWDVQDAPCTE